MDQITFSEAEYQTKKRKTRREIHQTRKGNQWYFGMKMHIGVDDTLGLIHSIDTTAANVHDIVPAGNLLHGGEQRVFGDAGYLGIQNGVNIEIATTSPDSLPSAPAVERDWMTAN